MWVLIWNFVGNNGKDKKLSGHFAKKEIAGTKVLLKLPYTSSLDKNQDKRFSICITIIKIRILLSIALTLLWVNEFCFTKVVSLFL